MDPNLLPPPPPVAKAKVTQIAVVCSLCHTRLYAPLDKIGQTIKCPDCHTVNEIKGPQEPKEKPPTGPTLEGTEDYAMSDPGQRPAYRPLVAARGDYEILSALDPTNVATGWQLPKAPPATASDEGVDEEIQLSAPVERVQLAPEPVKMPDPEPEDKLYDGRYDDGLIGEKVDRREPDAWKKSPFLVGIAEFLLQPDTLGRVASYCIGLAVLLNLGGVTATAARSEEASWKLVAVVLSMFSAVGTGLWLGPFAATLLAIVQDTGNGAKEVDNWPGWDPTEWFFPALFLVAAALISGLPGMLLTSALFTSVALTSGFESSVTAAVLLSLPLPLSWLVLFPLVLYSMLAENSLFAPFSRLTLASLRTASEGWMLFYMFSAVLILIATAAGSLAFLNNFFAFTVGAIGLVITAFLYARLLGRLMWYAGQQVAKSDVQA